MTPPVIVFAEVANFYAAIERLDDPALHSRPIIVGGDPRKRGQVQSVSPEAWEAGVRPAMPMLEALERCPSAKAVLTNMARYREVARQFETCLRAEGQALEPAGLGAAFLDATGRPGDPAVLGRELVDRVGASLGLTARVGIAGVKFMARLAAEEAAPRGGVLQVTTAEEQVFLHPLDVARLPGVGPKTAARLAEFGAAKVSDVLALGAERLEAELGNHGLRILDLCRGRDPAAVRAAPHPHSLSQESTFDDGQLDIGVLWERLQQLAQSLEARLRQQGLVARRVSVKVRYDDHQTTTRSQTVSRPLAQAGEVHLLATSLLDRTHAGSRPVRLLGLSLGGLRPRVSDDRQLDLFSGTS